MGKIVALVLGMGVVMGVAYYAIKSNVSAATTGGTNLEERSGPKQTLDNVRSKAKDIEADTQKRADDMMKRGNVE